jgi:hypothetical protein
MLAPMTVADLDAAIGVLRSSGGDLRELHQVLMRATPLSSGPPMSALAAASDVVAAADAAAVDALAPRPRTVFRLLRHGAFGAAWEVLLDNATGVVEEPFHAATATGAARTAWRLPLLTRIEAPMVFADLPGFRDPRYDAPDDCYDITSAVSMRQSLDEIRIEATEVTFGGWAALDTLVTGPNEQVRLVTTIGDVEIAVEARRVRRPDLVSGAEHEPPRRAWAGWSASLDAQDPRLIAGSWALSVEIEHDGIVRRSPVGATVGDLARATARGQVQLGSRTLRWETSARQWHLVVT